MAQVAALNAALFKFCVALWCAMAVVGCTVTGNADRQSIREGNSSKSANSQLEANKRLVSNYYNDIILQGKIEKIDQYIGDTYIQHNPDTPNGKQAVVDFVKHFILDVPDGSVRPQAEIVRVLAEDDLVALHVKTNEWLGPNGSVIVDIYRIENGKLVEHWDVIQAIPETSVNNNTMY